LTVTGSRHRIAHRLHAVGHELRLGHQAGAEGAALHALAGAAAVQVDLVVAPAFGQRAQCGQIGRLAAAELQRHRVLARVEVEVPRQVAMRSAPVTSSAPVVTISVYSRVRRVIRRWKKRQWRSVQSSIGATHRRQGRVADAASGALRLINTLADGDSFGEEALLAGGSRNATVRMSTPGRLLALAKADFDALLRPPMVEEIAAPAAREMLMHGAAKLLDCRHAAEHAASRIAGARSLPLGSLRQDGVFAIDPDATYIVYCDTGRRSRAAAFLLYERGIRALSLTGGLSAWPYELEGTQV
jgi:rhodanese-related sulfurtransferase